MVVVSVAANYMRWEYDDTDDKRPSQLFGRRSGLSLYTGHLTGIQYVKGGIFGGIHPRLDRDGKPIVTSAK